MARANCVYCGAALPEGTQEAAAAAAQKVLQTRNMASLEAVARATEGREPPKRRYVVIDTAATPLQTIAEACGVSAWDARQWQAASRYRLVKIGTEPADGPLEAGLRAKGLRVFGVPEETILRSRNPIPVESIDPSVSPAACTVREDPEAAPARKVLLEPDLALILSATIRREKVRDQTTKRAPSDTRLEDGWLVHFHFRGGSRPWEIDPRKTTYEGAGLASAYMRTLELVRRLSTFVPHDDGFKNVVPALSQSADPSSGVEALAPSAPSSKGKEPRVVILDNVAQFREYSAWRGAVERAGGDGAGAPR
jgi:hypothetical protein